jgi:hypothetical protein
MNSVNEIASRFAIFIHRALMKFIPLYALQGSFVFHRLLSRFSFQGSAAGMRVCLIIFYTPTLCASIFSFWFREKQERLLCGDFVGTRHVSPSLSSRNINDISTVTESDIAFGIDYSRDDDIM